MQAHNGGITPCIGKKTSHAFFKYCFNIGSLESATLLQLNVDCFVCNQHTNKLLHALVISHGQTYIIYHIISLSVDHFKITICL